MTSVRVSPEFLVVIPKAIRRSKRLQPGTRLHVFRVGDRIELVRIMPAQWYRGFLKGISTDVARDEDRA